MNETGEAPPRTGSFRRVCGVLLSLAVPGAGHCLLGAFRRGVAWVCGLAMLRLLVLFVMPIAVAIWGQLAIGMFGRVAAAVDAARMVRPAAAWRHVAAGLLVVIAGVSLLNLTVVTPLASYYAERYAQAIVIPTAGMEPTLLVGDSIIVDRSAYREQAPRRHDIVLFAHPEDEERRSLGRIVGLPGEVVVVRGVQVLINGGVLRESYLAPQLSASPETPLVACAYGCEPTTVPAYSYFVLGDNRYNSEDSRHWGFVTREKIKGIAHAIYWSWDPLEQRLRAGRIGRLP